MRVYLLTACLLFASSTFCQLAKVTFTDEQKYAHHIKRGVVIVTPFSKAIRSVSVADLIPDPTGGYIKFRIAKANVGSTKSEPYASFIKLDNMLNITSQKETTLPTDDPSFEPVGTFDASGKLNLLMSSIEKGEKVMRISYWQFDLGSFALLKKNIPLVDFPFDKSKKYDFMICHSRDQKSFGLTVLEEGDKKDAAILHTASFASDLTRLFKVTTQLPYLSNKGKINDTEMADNGAIYSLLDYTDSKKDDFMVNTLLVSTKEKQQLVPLMYKGEPIINSAFFITAQNEVLIAGMNPPSKKDYCTALVFGRLNNLTQFLIDREETFNKELLGKLGNADERGLKKDYYVRSISQRPNGMIDVVLNYCKQERYSTSSMDVGGGRLAQTTEVEDLVVLSYNNNMAVATHHIPRRLAQEEKGMITMVNKQKFSIPQVFTVNNDLYLLHLDNPLNFVEEKKKKINLTNFYDCSLMLSRLDAKGKITQQQLISFERKTAFPYYLNFRVNKMNDQNYVLTAEKYKILSKDVTSSGALLKIN